MGQSTTLPVPVARSNRWWQQQRRLAPYLFISPFYVLFFLFFLGPILMVFYLSFQQVAGINSWSPAGLSNYQRLLSDRVFQAAVVNTLYYMLVNTLILIPLPLLLAVALNARMIHAKGILRTIYFSPYLTAPVALGLVFLNLFDWHYGLFNTLLIQIGLVNDGINWLGDPAWVKLAITIVLAWRWVGYNMIYFLAGLQTIPHEVYEAATVDGATTRQQFFHITLPLLRPILLFVGIVSTIGAAQIFDEPSMLTGSQQSMGRPGFASLSYAQEIYREAFFNLNYGYAAAMSVILFVVLALLSWLQFRVYRGGEI